MLAGRERFAFSRVVAWLIILRALCPIAVKFDGKAEMARAGGTQIALRTTVMIGALLVLLMMALLPGPVSWLLGSQHQPAERDELIGKPRGERDGSQPVADPAGSGQEAAFGGAATGTPVNVPGADPAAAELTLQRAADTAPAAPTDAAGELSGRYREITSKLRELGAAYHRLETWEGDTKVYRFQCALTAGGAGDGGEAYRTFQATGTKPADAMERVLADVRAWRNGGLY